MPNSAVIEKMPDLAEGLLTARELAGKLGCGLRTVRRWTAEGRMKGVIYCTIGETRLVRYRWSEVLGQLETGSRHEAGEGNRSGSRPRRVKRRPWFGFGGGKLAGT
jgi:excisionase family DNA binding protein